MTEAQVSETERLPVTVRASPEAVPFVIRQEVWKRVENELRCFLLPPGEYPEYVDVFVRYPEVLAKIRIHIREQEEL